jgi:hypothetical protein
MDENKLKALAAELAKALKLKPTSTSFSRC